MEMISKSLQPLSTLPTLHYAERCLFALLKLLYDMKPTQVGALAAASLLAMSFSCRKEGDALPREAIVTGRVLKTETTWDSKAQNPRPRWVVDIAPQSLEGNWPGHVYQQAKVFNLPDTVVCRAGRLISFHYQVVPAAQQTPWKTPLEWVNTQPAPAGAEPLAEITLSDVQLMGAN
jgi:hypothetical protein